MSAVGTTHFYYLTINLILRDMCRTYGSPLWGYSFNPGLKSGAIILAEALPLGRGLANMGSILLMDEYLNFYESLI